MNSFSYLSNMINTSAYVDDERVDRVAKDT